MRILPCILLALFLVFAPASGRAEGTIPWTFSNTDLDHARNTLYWLEKGRWNDAKIHARRTNEPAVAELFEWMYYSSPHPDAPFADIAAFLRDHPEWPDQGRLYRNAENSLNPRVAPRDIVAWFSRSVPGNAAPLLEEPFTARGKYYLALALRKGEAARLGIPASTADRLLREAWIGLDTDEPGELKFLKEYGKKFTEREFAERVDRLLWDDKITAANSLLGNVTKDNKKLFEVRIKLMQDSPGIDAALAKLPPHLQDDEGLLYERLVWRARRGKHDGMQEILLRISPNSPYAWRFWPYREPQARRLLQQQQYQKAYDLVANHGLKEGADFADAEWLAGWIALRLLDDPKLAYRHFFSLYHSVKTPISLARAAYWAGRAAERNANSGIAKKWFVVASKYPTAFYGQLATERIGGRILYLPATPQISPEDRARFKQNGLAKAAVLLHRLKENRRAQHFLKAAVRSAKTPGEKLLIAQMGAALGRLDYGILAAKEAALEGVILPEFYYPAPPAITTSTQRIAKHPEPALVHAIILQESLFDTTAKSPRGARGLMQLMPGTAKSLARQLRIRFDSSLLTSDSVYNVKLGALHLRELIEQNRGSYVLTIAGYNAGSGNVSKWLKSNGDPRAMLHVDHVVDWIERIPFEETRNYVQRVTENLQLYRYRLGAHDQPYVKLSGDLWR